MANLLLRRIAGLTLGLALLLASAAPSAAPSRDTFTGVGRIVAVGDVHGGFDEFVAILRAASVIDGQNRWCGGRTHLVQTGDLIDRAAGSRKVMDLVLRLEGDARRSGGRVHALLGNHEVMNVSGDLRYTSPGEFGSFTTPASARRRDRLYDSSADPILKHDPAYREQWYAEHPLGWAEHRHAFGPDGSYGKWIRRRNVVVRIDDYLFLHGGLSSSLQGRSIVDINAAVRRELGQAVVPADGLAAGRDGPLWYRGLARDTEDDLRTTVDALLTRYRVRHIVIGHTTMPGAVVPRLGGKLLLIDVGLSAHFGATPACLVVERGVPFALHRGKLLRLPATDGDGLMEYLRAAEALDPAPSPLAPLIANDGRLPLPAAAREK